MKKGFAVLGGLLAAAAVVPFSHRKDETSGEESFHALIWNARVTPDQTEKGKKDVQINLALTNPFAYKEEYRHYDDEALNSTFPGEASPEDTPADETVYF